MITNRLSQVADPFKPIPAFPTPPPELRETHVRIWAEQIEKWSQEVKIVLEQNHKVLLAKISELNS